jgi:hypothetical protein
MHRDAIKPEWRFHSGFFLSKVRTAQPLAAIACASPAEVANPQYFSRHFYDLAMLLDTEDGKAACSDFDLLAQVAEYKAVFFRSAWASYDSARPGSLRLRQTRCGSKICAPTIWQWPL